jgi:hypothetical protein
MDAVFPAVRYFHLSSTHIWLVESVILTHVYPVRMNIQIHGANTGFNFTEGEVHSHTHRTGETLTYVFNRTYQPQCKHP